MQSQLQMPCWIHINRIRRRTIMGMLLVALTAILWSVLGRL